jgi:hypothetical protein
MRRKVSAGVIAVTGGLLALVAGLVSGPAPDAAQAASHREAPLISLDPAADITDFFAFRSYESGRGDRVVLIMNVIPAQEPSSGPNYYNFDPTVVYSFNVDNDMDGEEDIVFNVRFQNEIRGVVDALGLPLSYVAVPPITSLDGAGSEGLGLRQKYSVEMLEDNGRFFPRRTILTSNRIAVPSNVGPRTTPNYASLRQQGIYNVSGARVFAGQAEDPFYIDLGGAFDTLNFRRPVPSLSPLEDASDTTNPFGVDQLGGFNVNTIALELPVSMLTADGKGAEMTAKPKLGFYASTSRSNVEIRAQEFSGQKKVQVQRLANPLINELIIGTEDKDEWNRTDPQFESQFLDYYLNPRFAAALELVYGAPAAKVGRTDLVDLLLRYGPGDRPTELLRLDVSVDPKPLAQQKRLTVLAGDNAGWPNGRRPKDDVTDIATRVVGGPVYTAINAGDGVNTNDAAYPAAFPFVALPNDGRNLDPNGHPNP